MGEYSDLNHDDQLFLVFGASADRGEARSVDQSLFAKRPRCVRPLALEGENRHIALRSFPVAVHRAQPNAALDFQTPEPIPCNLKRDFLVRAELK